ncbi:NUDIX domain-containing protein [Microbulbifer sp. S227A]|uniref:NUDIX domain-containing protein n=1 Tax=Microbulbifer sp. S227A TaxID=3415131 RepID=UPI003C7E35A2
MIPRFGAAPLRDQIYMRRIGVYALLPKAGRLLLTRQCDPDPDLQLPGGGVDPGESPVVALHREVYEETGWHIARPRRVGAFRRFAYLPDYDLWAEKMCLVYVATPTMRIGPPTEPLHEPIWSTPRQAAQSLGSTGDRHFASLLARSIIPH